MLTLKDVACSGGVSEGSLFVIENVESLFPDCMPTNLRDQVKQTQSITLLMTYAMKTILDQVRDFSRWKSPIKGYGCVLNGVGGAGKSTILFAAVALARFMGRVVVYLVDDVLTPSTLFANVLSAHSDKLPQDIKDRISSISQRSYFDYVQCVRLLFDHPALKQFGVLLVIDNWNNTWDCKDQTKTAYMDIFNNFSSLNASNHNGFALCAVSSLLNPIFAKKAFSDGDAQLKQFTVKAFTDADATTYIAAKHQSGDLHPQLTPNFIKRLTGRVPGLISYLERTIMGHTLTKNYDDATLAELQNAWTSLATYYYKQRVMAVLSRTENDKVRNHLLMKTLYNNEPITDITKTWESSGLFLQDAESDYWKPVCEVAKKTVISVVSEFLLGHNFGNV